MVVMKEAISDSAEEVQQAEFLQEVSVETLQKLAILPTSQERRRGVHLRDIRKQVCCPNTTLSSRTGSNEGSGFLDKILEDEGILESFSTHVFDAVAGYDEGGQRIFVVLPSLPWKRLARYAIRTLKTHSR